MTTTAIYTRISNDAEGRELGVQRQEEDCRPLAGPDAQVYVDNDRGASTLSSKARPAYAAMLDAVRAGKIDRIVSYSNSRLTRRPAEWLTLIELANAGKVKIETVASGSHDLSTADGRAVALTVAAWDAAEAERTGERLRRAFMQSAEQGKRHGFTPYGHRSEDEADVVRRIVRDLLAGRPLRTISAELNAEGVPAPRTGEWNGTKTRQIAQRWSNAGIREHRGVLHEGTWEPLVSREDQERVIRLLSTPGRRTNAGAHRKHLLSGLVTCGKCGGPMRHVTVSKGREVYRCTSNDLAISYSSLDAFVLAVVEERLAQPDAAQAWEVSEAPRRAIEDRLMGLRQRKDGLAEDYADGVLDRDQVRAASARLDAQISEATDELRSIEQTASAVALAPQEGSIVDLDPDAQRALIRSLCDLTVLPAKSRGRGFDTDRVQVIWR